MSSKKSGPPSGKPLYPTQASSAAAYPGQPTQPPPYSYGQPMAAGAPPPYNPYQQPPAGAPVYGLPYAQPYAPPYAQPYGAPAAQPYVNQTVIVQGGFDAGARFDGHSRPNIPPPPPGCMPSAAQIAAAQGCNLVVTQRPSDLFTGGSDGGYTMF